MQRSFAAGAPQAIERVATIADSLGAPHAAPYSYALCRRYVDALVTIDDAAMRRAMGLLFTEMKLAVEPAGAAATAALLGPLAGRLKRQAHCRDRLRHQHRRAEVHGPGTVRLMSHGPLRHVRSLGARSQGHAFRPMVDLWVESGT